MLMVLTSRLKDFSGLMDLEIVINLYVYFILVKGSIKIDT